MFGRQSATEFWYSIGPQLGLKSHVEIDEFRRRYHSDESINTEVLDLIHQLHGRYKLAVLSNNPPGLDRWLADWGILELFDVIVCSGDEGLIKPGPAIYRLTLKQLGVAPHEAVFIDDTGGHVEAAQRLGIHGIVFTNAAELRQELNHFLLPSRF